MGDAPQFLTIASNDANAHLYGAPYYTTLPQRIDQMRGIMLFINASVNFGEHNLPSGFKLFVTAALLALEELEDREIMKALRPFHAVIIPAQFEFRIILHEAQHSLNFWHWIAQEFSQKLNSPSNGQYVKLPQAIEHLQADFLIDVMMNVITDILFFMELCQGQLGALLENHALLQVLANDDDDDDSDDDESSDDEEGGFDFAALLNSQLDSLMIVPKPL